MKEIISPDDKDYLYHQEVIQELKDSDEPEVFESSVVTGIRIRQKTIEALTDYCDKYDTLDEVEKNKEHLFYSSYLRFSNIEEVQDKISELRKKISNIIEESMSNFILLTKTENRNIVFFIRECLEDSELRDKFRRMFNIKTIRISPFIIMEKIIDAIKDNKFPSDIWYKMIDINRQRFIDKNEIFVEKLLPELKEYFLVIVKEAISKGIIPVSMLEIESAVNDLKCGLIDSTIAALEEIGGLYDSEVNSISISSVHVSLFESASRVKDQLPSKKLKNIMESLWGSEYNKFISKHENELDEQIIESRNNINHVFVHEVLHYLSGKTIVAEKIDPYDIYDYEVKQVGLKHVGAAKERLRWLNEAVTEFLTRELINTSSSFTDSYNKEIELFNLLCTSGRSEIPKSTFIQAYFENYDSSKPEEERLVAWKTLLLSLKDNYSKDFIVRLDNVTRKEGLDKGIEMIKGFNHNIS